MSGSPASAVRPRSQWHPDSGRIRQGFWSVTRYDDCVGVNRDYEHFSSYRAAALFHDIDEEGLGPAAHDDAQHGPAHAHPLPAAGQQGVHPPDDPGPRSQVVASADTIIDRVCEQGTADFVEQISAELPLQVIADLMGIAGRPPPGLRLVEQA